MNPLKYQAKSLLASYNFSLAYRYAVFGAEFTLALTDSTLHLIKAQNA